MVKEKKGKMLTIKKSQSYEKKKNRVNLILEVQRRFRILDILVQNIHGSSSYFVITEIHTMSCTCYSTARRAKYSLHVYVIFTRSHEVAGT